jgi:hypothetical protein
MKTTHIRGYSEKERAIGKAIARDLLTPEHTIKSARAIYPEYQLRDPFGLHRPGVNLGAMMFLYRQVVAYVPPIRKEQFSERFGVEYETFIRLANPTGDEHRFIFPVLNHPSRYQDPLVRRDLAEILVWMPPTWERWHEALRVSGGMRWFQAADERFDYEGIWSLESLRDTWKQRLRTANEARISREIKQQVRNNYTDLQLVARPDLADSVAELSHVDPATAYADLVYSSDLLAYPAVMGAGGMANVRATAPRVKDSPSKAIREKFPTNLQHFDTEVLESMLEGLHFDKIPASFRLSFLEEWHRSAQADTARRAYGRLLELVQQHAPSTEEVHGALKTILRELQNFCRNAEPDSLGSVAAADKKQRVIVRLAAAGSLAATLVGILVPDLLWMAIAGGTSGIFTIVGAKTWFDRERILRALLKRHAPSIPEDLFQDYTSMREFVLEYWRRSSIDAVSLGTTSEGATSTPVRTVWWVEDE